MTEININSFSGANNIKSAEDFYSAKGVAAPRIILNADVDLTGKLTMRKGRTLHINLPGAHSLWAGNLCCLAVAENVLYRIHNGIAITICTLAGTKSPVSFIDVEDKVYFSNPYTQGIFNPFTNSVSVWGIVQPPGPMLLSGDGNLVPGTYHVTMTNVVNGELSGNGAITQIELAAEGGIQILNRPAGALVWVTDSDEYLFYLVGAVDKIVDLPTVEPLPSFLCSPPPYLENLCYAFGRIWGSNGSDVYYSQPFNFSWFKLNSNKYSFEDEVTLIAKVPTGLFIGMKNRTKFLLGTIPEQMSQQDAGAGSIKNTLAYCNNMPELGWTLGTPEKDFADVPVWLTTEGIVVGNPSGKFFNITKNKIKMSIPEEGASLYRNLEGKIQFLTSFRKGTIGSGAGFSDADTDDAFKNGAIPTSNKTPERPDNNVGFSDIATCVVTRGGVPI